MLSVTRRTSLTQLNSPEGCNFFLSNHRFRKSKAHELFRQKMVRDDYLTYYLEQLIGIPIETLSIFAAKR